MQPEPFHRCAFTISTTGINDYPKIGVWPDLYKFHVDFKTPNKSTFTGPSKIAIKPWKQVNSITEPKPGEALDSLGDRLMYRLAYRKFSDHEVLTAAHSVDRGDGAAGIRWYEIRTPSTIPALFQQGTFVDPGKVSVWMPGMAMDKVGNIALGLSRASSAVKPGVSMTGRVPTDPVGTTGIALTVIAGTGVQQGDGGRWGDYTSMSVDPLDDCTFWFTTEYGKTTGSNWATRVVSAKFPTCK